MRKFKIQNSIKSETYLEGTAEEVLSHLIRSGVKFVDTDRARLVVTEVPVLVRIEEEN